MQLVKRELIITDDGSHSIFVEELRETFHSERGSIQESLHTFIKEGLEYSHKTFGKTSFSLLEIGFGTGLNALMTLLKVEDLSIDVCYDGIDAFPLEENIYRQLNFEPLISGAQPGILLKMHELPWEQPQTITEKFSLHKIQVDLLEFNPAKTYELIYFDAFAPSVQPALWTYPVFEKLYNALSHQGVLVTYSAAGSPRRAMQKAGFWIEEIRGAIGKREMTRAVKL